MSHFRLLATGIALTLLTAAIVANYQSESRASCYYIDITYPTAGEMFPFGNEVDIDADYDLPGAGCCEEEVEITGELQCTMTSRVEDTDSVLEYPSGTVYFSLIGPDETDSDVLDPFCVVVSGGGETDRVGVSFFDPGCCY